ncbi:MAG: phosphate/phosphite/phosphonate ABC transporter substrate-binding protein [Chloroflexi bacterium]|nr:phosphate/phosphite/phosphonate ABC transporter substrate-binding protein [Chloroflexota bacterium]
MVKRWLSPSYPLWLLLLIACASTDATIPRVRLGDLETNAPTPSAASASDDVLRIAVAPVYSPRQGLALYQDLAVYLGQKLNRPAQLVQGKTYDEINNLVREGTVALAIVCTNAYLEGQEQFGMQALVVPQVKGETVYYAYLIVPADSPARSLADLRGKTFAFSDPLSNTGRLVAVDQLLQMGTSPEAFFSRTIFTYSHDNSIKAVAENLVDGATVDNQVFDFLVDANSPLPARTKIIARYGPFGSSPLVVNPNLDAKLKAELRDILLALDADDAGRAILAQVGIDRFVVPDDRAYDSVRAMRERARMLKK